jgi:hypothetical protein
MSNSIRWVSETVELEFFPNQTQRALMGLRLGTFTAIKISIDTQLFVKRLTAKAFQLGYHSRPPARLQLQPCEAA